MLDWIKHFATGFITAVHHHNTLEDGSRNSANVYIMITVFLVIGLVILAIVKGFTEEDPFVAGRYLALVPLAFIWPYVALLVMGLIALALPTFMVYSWFKLIPTREQRAAKVQSRVAALRAEKNEVMS